MTIAVGGHSTGYGLHDLCNGVGAGIINADELLELLMRLGLPGSVAADLVVCSLVKAERGKWVTELDVQRRLNVMRWRRNHTG